MVIVEQVPYQHNISFKSDPKNNATKQPKTKSRLRHGVDSVAEIRDVES